MNKIGRKVFYDLITGSVITDTGERQGNVSQTTIAEDVSMFTALSERNRETFDVLELPYGAYQQDFSECSGYRVNVETKMLEFSYPDPNAKAEEPVFQKPLSLKVSELQSFVKTANDKYLELNKVSTPLSELQKAKLDQLDELCSQSIIKGFNHTIGTTEYLFSCSLSAQSNFQGTNTLFKDGLITETEWTVVNISLGNVERILLSQVIFDEIKLKVYQHINDNISRFRNTLQPLVESATTNEEVDSIIW